VRIEKGGKPTVVIVAKAFVEEIATVSGHSNIPYLPFVCVDYEQSFLPLIPQQVEKVFDKMVKALTTPAKELERNIPGELK
jgi:hypothetical protein